MGFDVKILADSVATTSGVRLTTFEVTFPRIVLAEFNTHRVFSRNSASSRAIPTKKILQRVQDDPYIPSHWGKNMKGMQATAELTDAERARAEHQWLLARDHALHSAKQLLDIGLHKQITNRLLEPFMWHTVIVTATEWSNFFHLRNNPDAHPDIQKPAQMMQELYESLKPTPVKPGEWHLPLVDEIDRSAPLYYLYWCKVSVGRCARVSYLAHNGVRDQSADVALHDRLLAAGHLSPFEHVARPEVPTDSAYNRGNFRGWTQYRKLIRYEDDILNPQNPDMQIRKGTYS